MRLPAPTVRTTIAVLAFDAVALGVWWYLIPRVKRPGDVLFVMLAVLGILTALFVANRVAQSLALVAASLGVALFGVEMAQKYVNLLDLFSRPAAAPIIGDKSSPYAFDVLDAESYIAARERAVRDGVPRTEIEPEYAGDIFAGTDPATLVVHLSRHGGRLQTSVSRDFSPFLTDSPLGVEMRPDFVWRLHAESEKSGERLFDGAASSDRYGNRTTGGDEDADDVRIFMGCSYVYGTCLNDNETLPEIYSRLHGFKKRVVNLGIGGAAPNHALRDLELNRRPARAGVAPEKVKAVYFGYIGDHATRVVVNPYTPDSSPRYVLENGRLAYKGTFGAEDMGRLSVLLSRIRLLPALAERATNGANRRSEPLALAILEKMHAICQERYGVPLHVLFWDGGDAFRQKLLDAGMTVTMVPDIFGADAEKYPVKYRLADLHPTPHANRLIAQYLHALDVGGGDAKAKSGNL